MLKNMLKAIAASISVLLLYLLFWPVPIDPVSWLVPQSKGFVGAYKSNDRLAHLDYISLGHYHGPEDLLIIREDNNEILYATTSRGAIIRIDPKTGAVSEFANTGGRPLGIERDAQGNFIIADAYKGLLKISVDGKTIKTLTNTINGESIGYADDVAVADNGMIYFSDASTKFPAHSTKTILEASLLEILEHGRTGRILSYNPETADTHIVDEAYSFANGIAMCPQDRCILVNETGEYAIRRIWLQGPKAGTVDTILENIPGFPDNLNRGSVVNGVQTYWLGMTDQRSQPLDDLADKPFMRKVIQRLPAFLVPEQAPYSFVVQIDAEGHILQTLQDPKGKYPFMTGAIEAKEWLYLTSLESPLLGRVRFTNVNESPL